MAHKFPSLVLAVMMCVALLPACGCGGGEDASPGNEVAEAQPEEESQILPAYTNYWSHTELPQLTNDERIELAAANSAGGEEFVEETNARARELSDALEDHIRRWLAGEAPAQLPEGLLPEYIDTDKTGDWTLVRPDEVTPEEQWYAIPSHPIDPAFEACYMLGSDAHVTYGKLLFVAPIGSELLVEGDFPHARYFSYEILPPLDPEHPASGCMGETPEVPIVDADIEPDPSSTNPYRVGADRNAAERHYHLEFDLQLGNAVDLNPLAMKSPEYRAPGKGRTGGPFGFAGAWGDNVFTPSVLWMRIYAPDRESGVLGGVSLPRATLRLDTGEEFWLRCDFSVAEERQTTRVPAGEDIPREPFPAIGPQLGWSKIFGLAQNRAESAVYFYSQPYGDIPPEAAYRKVRHDFLLLFNRGEDAEPPGNFEGSSTTCKNNHYLNRMFQLGPGKVYVITGKMPTFPATRDGEATMTGGEVRYWSINQYGRGEDDAYETAVNYNSLMDDEVVLNGDREYVIVYSTAQNRPANATPENGVTWVDWGPRARQTLTIRWMSVIPEWDLPQYSPDEYNLPWAEAARSGTRYDETLVGTNQPGVMGLYHPVIHYLGVEEFEALGGGPLAPRDIPTWE
ncbi:MAG: hypothetical protein JW854_04750 [Actinobacteria bacterium]|nr:hypothetical protein [Actinomycetota bacterium]